MSVMFPGNRKIKMFAGNMDGVLSSNGSEIPSIISSSGSDTDSDPGHISNDEVKQTFMQMQQAMESLRSDLYKQQKEIETLKFGLDTCQSRNKELKYLLANKV